ncbi:unnamed protein product [Adineta steineri]|uniref:Uncharacterized protein n=1 Tax=Adineta steineri TaxID=433720 RepID=A0A815H4U7_9BILA|nr:unnamed protein product [Adineta steineri]CAF1595554.1 unnamed protein product [Adineta steineri]
MISFDKKDKRYSIVSYSSSSFSKDSIDSQLSIIENYSNKESEKKITCSKQFLFYGPLVVCLILLISGIILFMFIEQQHNKHEKEEIIRNKIIYPFTSIAHDNFMPVTCSYNIFDKYEMYRAATTLRCGSYRSSLIHIFYFNYSRPINYNENIVIKNTSIPPNVQLNFDFLTKMNFNSFVLILLDQKHAFFPSILLVLHWIRYFSSFVEDGYDICQYKDLYSERSKPHYKMALLYATNSSQTMITAKTICYITLNWSTLSKYIEFIGLELVATMKFQIILD